MREAQLPGVSASSYGYAVALTHAQQSCCSSDAFRFQWSAKMACLQSTLFPFVSRFGYTFQRLLAGAQPLAFRVAGERAEVSCSSPEFHRKKWKKLKVV
jgi:hypothetical protein